MNAISKGYAGHVIGNGLIVSMFLVLFVASPAGAQDSSI